jgi:hypothetical protein
MTCSVCGRSNPPDSALCECGYSFKPRGTAASDQRRARITPLDRCPQCLREPPPQAIRCEYCGYPLKPQRREVSAPQIAAVATPQTGIPWLYRLCLALILLWTVVCMIGACYGMVNVSTIPRPTDPWAQTGHDVGVAIGLGMWAVVWVIPTAGLGIIGLLAKPR